MYAFDTFTERIDLYQDVEYFLADKLKNDVQALKKDAEHTFLFYSFLSSFIFIFLLILKHFTGLNIYKTVGKLNRSLKSFDKNVIASNTDQYGVITYASEAFCKITGYTEDELIGKPHSIIRHNDMPKELFSDIWNTITAGNEYKGEIKNKKKNGELYWLKISIYPQYDRKNNITGFSSVGQEITDKKALEELSDTLELQVESRTLELEKERHFIDTILNTQEQMIITTNGKTIKSANNAFMQFYNIKKLTEFTDVHNCICETFSADSSKGYLQVSIDGRKWTDYIHDNPNMHHKAMIKKDGTKHIFSVTLSKVEIEDEMLEVAVFSDITQVENSREEIKRKVEEGLSEIKSLNEEIIETQREVIFTMGTICETKSKETGNHVKRVAAYTEILALKYGMDPEEARLLKEASPMHDVGKIGIDDDILKKPGALTDKEFEIMKTHTQIGYDMLKFSKRAILKTAAIVAKEHHEKYDGTGYPENLKGNDIHIYGRITALADVFDALGSDRCYKKAWDDEKIFQLIQNERGKHFDPKLIDIFFNNIDQFLAIRDRYRDTPEMVTSLCLR